MSNIAVTYTFTNTEVADAAKFNTNYTDLVDAINDLDGGTATNTSRITLPKNTTANIAVLTRKEATIVYDSTIKKIVVDDGSVMKAVGGGLVPVAIDKTYATTLESGKHYLLDAVTAAADITLNLPVGATEADIKVTVINIPVGYKVIIAPNGSEKIFYNDTDNATVEFVYTETEAWGEFIWNGTKWLVNDNSNVLSGTFSGAMTFTGLVTANSGVVLDDAVGQSALNYYATGSVAADGSFTSGTIYYTRVGNVVTISTSVMGHASLTYANTSAIIPVGFRPTGDATNVFHVVAGFCHRLWIYASGIVEVAYYDDAFAPAAQTGTSVCASVSYII